MSPRPYPADWLERVPAVVFGCLRGGELRVTLLPGVGLAHGGAPRDVPAALVPPDLWVPNTPVWVELDQTLAAARVWRREEAAG